jgi:hypothetical protein
MFCLLPFEEPNLALELDFLLAVCA